MKEELQSKMVEILGSIQSATGKMSDFAIEQLPDIAQSYIAYGRTWSVITLCMSLGIIALAVWMVFMGRRAVAKDRSLESNSTAFYTKYGRLQDDGIRFFLPGALIAMFGVMFTVFSAQFAVLVWMAQKVWLLKEIAGLIK